MSRRPEILAPAGDPVALKAALAAGADAVYFGLDAGFNARARATNFDLAGLPETVAAVHRAGAKAYVTLNTLVFEPELPAVERLLRSLAEAGVDAIIVQDPAVALLAREVCPALDVHASTQMTIASPEAAAFAADLGVSRVVVPRELSVDEIRRFAAGTDLELEVFVHGALCMSWSGQCLTSEAWGGRSANRGQCAQSCRLPYDLVVDGAVRDLGEVRYLLSPKDLLGLPVIPDLAEIGVASLKIEGRQKSATYVSTAVQAYRARVSGGAPGARDLALAYSRGFGSGFFGGSDHQALVDGRFPKHRGILIGTVVAVRGGEVEVEAAGELLPTPGLGVVFDAGDPEDKREPGGPLFRVTRAGGRLVLGFGRPGPDLGRVRPGQRVWATSDPALQRATERSVEGEPCGRVAVELTVRGEAGAPLTVEARAGRAVARAATDALLTPARGEGLDERTLREKLGALGGTPFRLEGLTVALEPGLYVGPSALKGLRRALVEALLPQVERGPARVVGAPGAVERVRGGLAVAEGGGEAVVVPLCRTDAQLEAVIDAGLPEVELDWMELVGLGRAVERAKAAGLKVTVATLRVTRPGEGQYDERLLRLAPDAVLVRHWAALERFRGAGVPLHGDFSLNVANALTARLLLGRGLETVTASFDLDEAQLSALLAAAPPARVTVMVYHRIPTFHTEHCVYAHLLSEGRDWQTCGRPCERHEVSLRDAYGGREHPVIVDAGCRNTVFNAETQSAAALVPALLARGVRRFRVQLVRESRQGARRVLEAHRALLQGAVKPAAVIEGLGLVPQLGVGAGAMETLT